MARRCMNEDETRRGDRRIPQDRDFVNFFSSVHQLGAFNSVQEMESYERDSVSSFVDTPTARVFSPGDEEGPGDLVEEKFLQGGEGPVDSDERKEVSSVDAEATDGWSWYTAAQGYCIRSKTALDFMGVERPMNSEEREESSDVAEARDGGSLLSYVEYVKEIGNDLHSKGVSLYDSTIDLAFSQWMKTNSFLQDLVNGLRKSHAWFDRVFAGLLDNMCKLFHKMYWAKNIWQVVHSIYVFLKELLVKISSYVWNKIVHVARIVFDFFSNLNVSLPKVSVMDFADMFSTVLNSSVVQAFRDLICCVVSLRFFNRDISRKIVRLIGAPTRMPIMETIATVFKSIGTLYNAGLALSSGIPLSHVLLGEDGVMSLIERGRELLTFKDLLYSGLPTPGMMCQKEFIVECDELIVTCDEVMGQLHKYDERSRTIKVLRRDLSTASERTKAQIKALDRIPPIGIVMHGYPGIGKSKLVKLFPRIHAAVKGRKYSDDQIYNRSKTSQYWEGYLPASHPYIHYSEIGNEAARCVDGPSEILQELNSIVDGLGFNCDMAFGDKGRVYANPELVVIDTNNKDMHITRTMYSPAAMYRRFIFIEAKVLPEFCKQGSTELDGAASLAAGGDLLDRYTFIVETYDAFEDRPIRKRLYAGRLPGLYDLMVNLFTKHIEHHDELLSKNIYQIVEDDDVKVENGMYDFVNTIPYSDVSPLSCVYMVLFFGLFWKFKWHRDTMGILKHLFKVICVLFEMIWAIACYCYARLRGRPVKLLILLLIWFVCAIGIHSLVAILAPAFVFYDYKSGAEWVYTNCVEVPARQYYENRTRRLRQKLLYFVGFLPAYDPIKIAQGYEVTKTVLAILGVVTIAYQAYVTYFKKKKDSVEVAFSKFYVPDDSNSKLNEIEQVIACDEGRVRFKTKNDKSYATIYTPVSPPSFHGSPDDLARALTRNVRRIGIYTDPPATTHVVGVCSTFALMNKHALLGQRKVKALISHSGYYYENHQNTGVEFVIDLDRAVDMGNDLILVDFKPVQFSDIVAHFHRGHHPLLATAYFNGEHVKARYSGNVLKMLDRDQDLQIQSFYTYEAKHGPGYCGLPLFSQVSSGSAIVGMHVAGRDKTDTCYAIPVDRDALEQAISDLRDRSLLMPIHSQCQIMDNLELPSRKSVMRYEDTRCIQVFGKLPGPVLMNKKSRLTPTPYSLAVLEILEKWVHYCQEEFYLPPVMTPKMVDGEYISPYNLAIRKINNCPPVLDDVIMRRVVDVFVNRIVTMLVERGVDSLSPFTVESSINGMKGDEFFQRINASTSGAYGYPGIKAKHLPIVFEDLDALIREASSGLKHRVVRIYQIHQKGVCVGWYYTVQLKDEPRLEEKVLKGATRLFYMGPLDNLIYARMLLGPFYTLMVEFGDIFCTSIGIDMHTMADNFVRSLEDFSPFIMEGDYSGYDVSNPFAIGHAASTVIYEVCARLGYNNDALVSLAGLLSDNLFPVVNMCGDLFVKPGMQMSGKYGTAEDNSLRGVVMLMYAWYANPSLSHLDFFEYVRPRVYGDDLLAAVRPEVADLYNNITYARDCMKYYDMRFTTAAKNDDFAEFMDVNTMSFLKRKFVLRDGIYVAQLSMESIYKSMAWYIPSDNVSFELQSHQTFTSALWELYFHTDRYVYDEIKEGFLDILCSQFGGNERDYKFPSYDEIDLVVRPVKTESGTFHQVQQMLHEYEQHLSDLKEQLDAIDDEKLAPLSIYDQANRRHFHSALGEENRRLIALLTEIDDVEATIRHLQRLLRIRSINTQAERLIGPDPMRDMDIHENVVDDGGEEKELISAGPTAYLPVPSDSDLDIKGFFSRPIEIANKQVTLSTDLDDIYNVWDLYTRNPTVRAKLRNFSYLRGTLHLRFAISGTPFHMGKLLLSYQPLFSSNANLIALESLALTYGFGSNVRLMTLNYLSQADGCMVVDVKRNKPVEMVCPFIHPKMMCRLFNDSTSVLAASTGYADLVSMGALYVWTINPVLATTLDATDVAFQIYAWMEDVELGVPTASVQEITTESGSFEEKYGPVENILTSAVDASQILSSLPGIGVWASKSTPFLRSMRGMAAILGWSRPVWDGQPSVYKNKPFMNSALTIGTETVDKITLDPLQALMVDPSALAVDGDDMVISKIASRPSFFNYFTWTTSNIPMVDVLFRCRVQPQIETFFTDDIAFREFAQPTALSYAVSPFRYWRGDITFRFEIVATSYHRGKLMFYYEPNIKQADLIDANISLNKNYIAIVDIAETQDIEITVEWTSPYPWLRCLPNGETRENYGETFSVDGIDWANGYIGVVPFTYLQSPDEPSVYVNMYVYSKNMQVNYMSDYGLPLSRAYAEVGFFDDAKGIQINHTQARPDHVASMCFGEQPVSFRSCLRRYVSTWDDSTTPLGVVTTTNLIRPIILPASPAYGSSVSASSLIGYLMYAYVGIRGGVRKRLSVLTTATVTYSVYNRCVVSNREIEGSLITSLTTGGSLAGLWQRGSVQFVPDTNAGVEVEVPFYCNNLFVVSFSDDLLTPSVSGIMERAWPKNYQAQFEFVADETDTIYVSEETAIGEDFMLMRYQGAPWYSYLV